MYPSYQERKDGVKNRKGKKEQTKSKEILTVLSMLGKQVHENSGYALTVDTSCTIDCVLLWEHPGRLGVHLQPVHETEHKFTIE